jgi:hypothetical protein
MTGKPGKLEDYMPDYEARASEPPSSDQKLMDKLDIVMSNLGGTRQEVKKAPIRTDDEFRHHMWNLMGVSVN